MDKKYSQARNKALSLFNRINFPDQKNFFYRAYTAVYLFDFLDRLRKQHFPDNWLRLLEKDINTLNSILGGSSQLFLFCENNFKLWQDNNAYQQVELRTGNVYYQLWKDFRKQEVQQQAYELLRERLRKNGISVKGCKHVLDDGCGSGRYSFALKQLGALRVTGVDISQEGMKLARKINPFSVKEVDFLQASVLDLPFKAQTFDCVFSNGVLHHTKDPFKGLCQIKRVLKHEGFVWMYLYGGKDSFFWDMVDYCRSILSGIPQAYVQSLMRALGYPPGRIFHRSDFFYVPIQKRYYSKELEIMFRKAGFSYCKRLYRGTCFDWDEMRYHNPNMDPYLYGEGEMRYLLRI